MIELKCLQHAQKLNFMMIHFEELLFRLSSALAQKVGIKFLKKKGLYISHVKRRDSRVFSNT